MANDPITLSPAEVVTLTELLTELDVRDVASTDEEWELLNKLGIDTDPTTE